MSTICSCAQVVCGGDHCPVDTALATMAELFGHTPDLDYPFELTLCLEEFYGSTAELYQLNCAFRDEDRRRCCRRNIERELRQIVARGSCNVEHRAVA
jgi:hypothetical protein